MNERIDTKVLPYLSERGVRKAPDLLPSHYEGGDDDDEVDAVDDVPFTI
jgi:hypothetical protein